MSSDLSSHSHRSFDLATPILKSFCGKRRRVPWRMYIALWSASNEFREKRKPMLTKAGLCLRCPSWSRNF